jgi:hypothetical protein
VFKFIGIALILIGVALVAVPTFTDCQSHGQALKLLGGQTTPMKCHWSGIAEIGVAVPLYIVGAVMTTNRNRKTLTILSVLAVALGGLAIAFPTRLIGVCPGPTMICNTVMKPLLIFIGGLGAGLGGLGLLLSRVLQGARRPTINSILTLSKGALTVKGV